MELLLLASGTSTSFEKVLEYALVDIQKGLYKAKQRGVDCLMPQEVSVTVQLASSAGLNDNGQQATTSNPEVITTSSTTNPAVTRTSTSTQGAQTNTTTPHGQQTTVVRTGSDQTEVDYEYTNV